MKKLLLLVVLGLMVTVFIGASGQYKKIVGSKTVYLTTSDLGDTLMFYKVGAIAAGDVDDSSWYLDTILGDTILYVTPAKIIRITPTALLDSFWYIDSVDGSVDAGADTISYQSPMYTTRFTPVVDTSKTYIFQVIYASGDTAGFTFDAGSVGTEPIDTFLIDSLIDSLTGIAGLNDSITFQDSVTYIKAIAKFATESHGGRWSVRCDSKFDPRISDRSGGRLVEVVDPANVTVAIICDTFTTMHNAKTYTSDSILATDFTTYFELSTKEGSQANTLNLPSGWSVSMWGESGSGSDADSAWDTTTTQAATIKSVSDGMIAAINAEATVRDTVEAITSGDTAYYVISRRHKRFVMTTDTRFTLVDSNATADTVFGASSVTDSIWVGNAEGFRSLHAKITIGAATGDAGLGSTDSAEVWLSSSGPAGSWSIYNLDTAVIPFTVYTVVHDDKGDSIIGEHIYIKYNYYDTLSDTNGVKLPFPISWDILLK